MGWQDSRAFLAEIERRSMVRRVEGADCDLEIGTLTEMMCERRGPMLLFDHINGFPHGYRIAGKPYATLDRAAVALGLNAALPPLAQVKAWQEKAFCHLIVVVDDDIDPSRPEVVLWAISTRADPATAYEIQTDCPSHTLDPILPPDERARGELTTSRAVIIACRPWQWLHQFPKVNLANDALRGRTLQKRSALLA